MTIHLICLKAPSAHVEAAVKALWPDDQHYQLNETQFLIAKPSNGGKSVYDRINDKAGEEFAALIVRFQSGYHGRHNADLWEWMQNRVRS